MASSPKTIDLKSIIQQKLDELTKLSDRVRTGNVSDLDIDQKLNRMIIMIIANLKLSPSYITALKEIAQFVREISSFLTATHNKRMISDDNFEKNHLFLLNKLNSCDKLPQGFIRDQVSLLNDM